MRYIVTLTNKGHEFWLRGTTWAFHAERADMFDSIPQAQAALQRAAKFMRPAMVKQVKIEQAQS